MSRPVESDERNVIELEQALKQADPDAVRLSIERGSLAAQKLVAEFADVDT